MKVKFKEHNAYLRFKRTKKYALVEHSWGIEHHVCLQDAKIIARIHHYRKRKVMESLKIELNPNNINRDEGWKLSETWLPLIHMIRNNQNINNKS